MYIYLLNNEPAFPGGPSFPESPLGPENKIII